MKEVVRANSFGKKNKTLIINEEVIQFGNKVIRRQEISGITYWLSGMQWYRFLVGTRYHIGLKTPTQEMHLVFKSYFNWRDKYFSDLCHRILGEIWDPITEQIYHANQNLLLAGQEVILSNCRMSPAGMVITTTQTLRKTENLISWPDLLYEVKYDRLVINHKKDFAIYTNLYFKDTWNIDVLIALLDWITQEDGLHQIQK